MHTLIDSVHQEISQSRGMWKKVIIALFVSAALLGMFFGVLIWTMAETMAFLLLPSHIHTTFVLLCLAGFLFLFRGPLFNLLRQPEEPLVAPDLLHSQSKAAMEKCSALVAESVATMEEFQRISKESKELLASLKLRTSALVWEMGKLVPQEEEARAPGRTYVMRRGGPPSRKRIL